MYYNLYVIINRISVARLDFNNSIRYRYLNKVELKSIFPLGTNKEDIIYYPTPNITTKTTKATSNLTTHMGSQTTKLNYRKIYLPPYIRKDTKSILTDSSSETLKVKNFMKLKKCKITTHDSMNKNISTYANTRIQ